MSPPSPDPWPVRWRLRWRLLRLLANRRWRDCIAEITLNGYLAQTGWLRSMKTREVTDAAGQPIPWYTVPFVDFLDARLRRDLRVFEYGAGASTHYFAARVNEVWAVEHDESFAAKLRQDLPANVHLLVYPENSVAYAGAVGAMSTPADFISVDGRDRVHCIERALAHLSPEGVLVLDDSERVQYAPGLAVLRAAGFRAVDFWGISVGIVSRKCTTVFYRDHNVLGI